MVCGHRVTPSWHRRLCSPHTGSDAPYGPGQGRVLERLGWASSALPGAEAASSAAKGWRHLERELSVVKPRAGGGHREASGSFQRGHHREVVWALSWREENSALRGARLVQVAGRRGWAWISTPGQQPHEGCVTPHIRGAAEAGEVGACPGLDPGLPVAPEPGASPCSSWGFQGGTSWGPSQASGEPRPQRTCAFSHHALSRALCEDCVWSHCLERKRDRWS